MRAFALAPRDLRQTLWLAGLTGLRLGDLVKLTWEQIHAKAIIVEKTGKTGGWAVIPILPDTRKLLNRIGRKTGWVLRNSRGEG